MRSDVSLMLHLKNVFFIYKYMRLYYVSFYRYKILMVQLENYSKIKFWEGSTLTFF